ncbi:MAG TPA: CHAD domain-containing protein [Candidatus Limnocylindrales bacterium]|nr:CHAD domain-containing protein [Candidatus Limnocylindrales bacterium]
MDATRPVEVELKYRVTDPAVTRQLLDAPGLGQLTARDTVRSTQTEDRYVDTPDGALARAGFAARLRRTGGGDVISVKSLASVRTGSMNHREELEGPAIRGDAPSDWPPSAARSLVLELAGDAYLVELVTIRQLRHRRHFGDGTCVVELSLDEVDVVASGRIVEHFTELEVELKEGPETGLAALAEILDVDPGLTSDPASKLQRALAAAGIRVGAPDTAQRPDGEVDRMVDETDPAAPTSSAADGAPGDAELAEAERTEPGVTASAGDPPPAETPIASTETTPIPDSAETPIASTETPPIPDSAEPPPIPAREAARPERPPRPKLSVGKSPGVRGDDTLAEAGRKVLRFHFARMLAREEGTRLGVKSEELHGMRVATRRMRAAFRVFGEAYRPGRTRRYRRDLRDTARRLGAVRDLDVLIEGLEGYAADQSAAEAAALDPLVAGWRQQREEARVLLGRTLDSAAYRRFVDGFLEFARTEGMAVRPVAPTAPHRVRDEMPAHIWAAYAQVRAYEPVLRWADVETLHDLRISAKWLRYKMEFVREPLGPEAEPLIERVVALQDHLGWLHDADVASGLARSFLVEHAADLTEEQTGAIGRYLVERERELARLRRSVGGPWRRVAGLAFRRALGRVVASL